jgi:predicted phosphoribosyltransferase
VAEALDAPLDVCVVRKLGVPGQEEVALGAIASGGARVLNRDVIEMLGISPQVIEQIVAREQRELHRRESAYRGTRPFPLLAGKTVIVVDVGAATGASMVAALSALRHLGPRSLIAAVPVASREAAQALTSVAEDCTCLIQPEPLHGVGLWYEDFSEVSDDEVRALLADAQRRWQSSEALHPARS